MKEVDLKDREILRLMQGDDNLSIGDIAERCNLSKSACWRRIQNFDEAGIIKTRTAILNAESLGLALTVYISVRTNQHNVDWSQRFKEITHQLDNVLEVHRMSGDLDYLIKAVVIDMKDFDRLYQELIKADLYDVSSSFVMEELKATTQLPI
ncbi:MAG: Lrp/AsnC family transcriptional regulator [Pseudomonadales bacterium]|jgi:Lrp/AsnC family transcriptional regulator